MDMEELAARLQMLEDSGAQQAQQAEQQGFIDQYGTMFSGDEGIGMAILAEMNRRGVPSAAVGADRVVQEILDQIRMEASQILDKIKMDRDTVNSLIEQVQEIQESVDAAVGGPDDAVANGMVDMGAAPPADLGAVPPVDMGVAPPPPADLGAVPPVDMGAGPPPPADLGAAPLPPIPSDRRLKITRRPAVKSTGWKPSSSVLGAIKGGL